MKIKSPRFDSYTKDLLAASKYEGCTVPEDNAKELINGGYVKVINRYIGLAHIVEIKITLKGLWVLFLFRK